MILYILLAIMSACSSIIEAEIGCMDRSKYLEIDDGYDYKIYDYVQCNCECSKEQRSEIRGRCTKCGHYRDYSLGHIQYYDYYDVATEDCR